MKLRIQYLKSLKILCSIKMRLQTIYISNSLKNYIMEAG